MKYLESVVRVVGVLLQIFLVRAEAQKVLQVSSCVRSVRNSSLLVISPSVLTSVLAGAGPHCQHCFTLLDNDLPILQGCWTPGDGCHQDCLLSKLINEEADPSSSGLKFCCCSSELCNSNWQDLEEEQEKEEKESQTTRNINRKELTVFHLDHFSLMITTISLSLSLVLLTVGLLTFYYRRRSQKNKILEKFYSEKVCLISHKI